MPQLQLDVKRSVISGMNIYSTSEYTGEELKYTAGQHSIKVKKVKVSPAGLSQQLSQKHHEEAQLCRDREIRKVFQCH